MKATHKASPRVFGSSSRQAVLAATLAAAALALGAAPVAAADNPLGQFVGAWSGTGTIATQNGSRERIRCRGNYTGEGGSKLLLNLRCASDSYKFELASNITYNSGEIQGSWNETSRQISGSLAGRASSNHIQAEVATVGFNASLSVTARGNSQNFSIKAPGNEISEVTVSLARGAGR